RIKRNIFSPSNFLSGCVTGRYSIPRFPEDRLDRAARSTNLIRIQCIVTNIRLVNKPLNLNGHASFRLSGTPQFQFELTCSPNLHTNPFSKMNQATMPAFNVVYFVDEIPNYRHVSMSVSPFL
ncbi:MAG TPA: hypothetical protein DEO70_06045, partial [Bacteroidales bacterium]|nr:hypothetical protein [Bacteroidales bacterium]